MSEDKSMVIAPCPFCGETPDIDRRETFQDSQGTKWGSVVCGCGVVGPQVRTGYESVEHWRWEAIDAWNRRAAPLASETAADPRVAVKPLDWVTYPLQPLTCRVSTILGMYDASPFMWRMAPYDGTKWTIGQAETLEAAKAAAQADFERRVLSLIVSSETKVR